MQTKTFLFVIGLGAMFVASTLTSGARDTEEQIKAREALRKKMSELDGAAATPPAAPAPAAAPAKPAKPAAPAAPPQTIVPAAAPAAISHGNAQFGPVPDAVEDANASQLREALRQQMAGFEPGPEGALFSPVPDAVQDPNASQAREALRQQMALQQRSPGIGRQPTRYGRATGYTPPVTPAPLVMEAPLPPLSGSKTARLAELLQRYNADQITPKEYHTQRAAILAEP
jgi:hypothetical protein